MAQVESRTEDRTEHIFPRKIAPTLGWTRMVSTRSRCRPVNIFDFQGYDGPSDDMAALPGHVGFLLLSYPGAGVAFAARALLQLANDPPGLVNIAIAWFRVPATDLPTRLGAPGCSSVKSGYFPTGLDPDFPGRSITACLVRATVREDGCLMICKSRLTM
ncbi:hypothetical protein BDY21DRAFT_9896 [Lineolata rhizophorae]|uniref:Thioesterase domain-containing protein n=1 Tax=Lineolata rhizophorae TaxID=578093 RepID=A0A6A6PE19_9PEZI|nr:hypothetical protein BDY21DRAFT_9896 [Lineolata rhizophorae]